MKSRWLGIHAERFRHGGFHSLPVLEILYELGGSREILANFMRYACLCGEPIHQIPWRSGQRAAIPGER